MTFLPKNTEEVNRISRILGQIYMEEIVRRADKEEENCTVCGKPRSWLDLDADGICLSCDQDAREKEFEAAERLMEDR